jgi:NitT/TauT family transport system permease protein
MNEKSLTNIFLHILLPIFLLLLIWQIVSGLSLVPEVFISKPEKVFLSLWSLFSTGIILPHVLASLEAFAAGFFLAVLIGISAGIIIGYYKKIYRFTKVYLFLLSALPTVAIIPLVIIWFGIGMAAKVFIVFFLSITPILINTIAGVSNKDKEKELMAKSFRAGNFFILKTLTIYESLPFILSGMKIAIGRGMIGIVVAEAFGYGKGLGYLLYYYGGLYQTANLMAIIIIILCINLIGIFIVSQAEKRLLYWKK